MTYATAVGEVSSSEDVWQLPNGQFVLGQANMQDTQAGPPTPVSQQPWALLFKSNYLGLRQAILTRASPLITGNETDRAAWRSVENAMARCDSVADAIVNGDTGRASTLLNIMGNIIRTWAQSYDERKSWLDKVEEILRGIPKNLQDAAAFVAEQVNQATLMVAGGAFGKVVIGATLAGLFGLYLWKKPTPKGTFERVARSHMAHSRAASRASQRSR